VVVKDKKILNRSKATATKVANLGRKPLSILARVGGYFKGSWEELQQVRWPDNRSTWGLTAAVILFTAFFVTLIVLLDAGFKQLFELILK
jgi:preprotein translocase SecE subunit